MEHFFYANSSGDLRWDAHQSQIIGENADKDHTQIIGGDTVKLFPPFPRVSRVSVLEKEVLGLDLGFFWVLGLEGVSSTPPLMIYGR